MQGTWRVPVSRQSHSRAPPGKDLGVLKRRTSLDLYVAPGKMRDTRGAKFYVAHVFSHRRGEEVLESTLAFYSFLTLTNLDREHEWARYLAMPAGSQNEGQSPLAQGA